MIIPPAGRERDRLIAELKGIKPAFACYVDNISGDNECVLDDEKPWDCLICEREEITKKEMCGNWKQRPEDEWLLPYSTNTDCAIELFEEMPYEIRHKAIQEWDEAMYEPDKFAPIISKAWIEWKEVNHE